MNRLAEPEQVLRLLLDPALLLRWQGWTPDPWQEEVLGSQARQVLLNCCRQAGKSTVAAALALDTALFVPHSLTLLLSPTQRQSSELLRKVRSAFAALGAARLATSATQTRLELANHSHIVSLPGQAEQRLRSFSNVALLIIDEAAQVRDDLYRTVRPMLAVSGGRLVCLSTPFGPRGFFWQEWQAGGSDWHRIRITADHCPRIARDFLEQERRTLGERWVRQEYYASFESLEGLVYPDFASQCGVDTVPPLFGQRVGGLDWGFRNPFAAIWGVLDHDDVLWITGEIYRREVPLVELLPHLPREVMWYADPAGRQEIETLRYAGFKVRQGSNEIQAGIAAVTARLRSGRLKVLRHAAPNLLAEASLYRYPGPHDDADSENPVDAHNHALGALRYLVSRLDAPAVARFRH
jgi:hypothetical protein